MPSFALHTARRVRAVRRTLILGAVAAPGVGLWAWIAQALQDGLLAGVLAGMALLSTVSFLPRHHEHGE